MFSLQYSSTPKGCSLKNILDKDDQASRWNCGRPSDKYRNIIRFVLQDLLKLETRLGYLDANDIFVTSGSAKVYCRKHKDKPQQPLIVEFISLIREMLGDENNPKRLELKHFIGIASMPGVTFEMLYHHPLLQSTSERYFFPIRVFLHMDNKKKYWRQEYRKFIPGEVDFNSVIENSKYKVGLKSVLNKQNQTSKYKHTSVDVLSFSKNVANHINDHLHSHGKDRMTLDEIENELTRMFPTRLIDSYEFLVRQRISMAFLSRH